jgi:hypothetical protein
MSEMMYVHSLKIEGDTANLTGFLKPPSQGLGKQ